jgi:hypothetical protein
VREALRLLKLRDDEARRADVRAGLASPSERRSADATSGASSRRRRKP